MTGGEWRNTRVKHVAHVTLGKMLQPAPKTPTDLLRPYARAASIGQDGSLVTTAAKSMWFSEAESRELDLRQNDILVVEGGDAGRSVMLREGFSGWGFQNSVNRVRAAPGVDPRFLHYALISARDSGYINAYCDVVSIAHLTAEKLKRLPVYLPHSEQQCAIADYLDHETAKIDTLIAKQEALIATLGVRRKSTIDDLLFDRSMTSRVALKHWLKSIDQGVSPQADSAPAFGGTEVGVLKSGCVNHGTFRASENKRLAADFVFDESLIVEEGDLIVSRASGSPSLVGSSAMVGKIGQRLILSDKLFRLNALPGVVPRFLFWYLNSGEFREFVRQSISGAEGLANNLPLSALRQAPVPSHNRDRQLAIAMRLDAKTANLDSLIAKTAQFIALVKERRAALITASVTGAVSPRT